MEFFSHYNPPPSQAVVNNSDSLTRQEFAKEGDVNEIMRKYAAGLAPIPSGSRPPQFGDFSNGLDYQAMLDKLNKAREEFEALPSRIRDRFGNDPAKLLEFLSDESNRDEAIKLGLVAAQEKPAEKTNVSVPGEGEAK